LAPSIKLFLIVACVGAGVSCSTARDPSKGFRLAGNGDPSRGRLAFVELECNSCHDVEGSKLPRAAIRPVTLGGSVSHQPSDGYVVTAIINPTYHAVRYPVDKDSKTPHPQMPEFASRMTVQQLTDIVAFLQSRYALSPLPVQNEYP